MPAVEGYVREEDFGKGSASVNRLFRACEQHNTKVQQCGSADAAVLLRAATYADKFPANDRERALVRHLIAFVSSADMAASGLSIAELDGETAIQRVEWRPRWAGGVQSTQAPDEMLALPSLRRPDLQDRGDPFLSLLGWKTYQTPAQKEAVRTVLSAPAGTTLIINLPTGAGKSACAVLPCVIPPQSSSQPIGVTPIIVPTVALQLDLEARVRGAIHHDTAYRPGTQAAQDITRRIEASNQGPVFLSPEAMVGSLRHALLAAAARGSIRYLVVDEAHMISAWGDDFRPDFQQISPFRERMLAAAPTPFSTLLMSGTLTPHTIDSLTSQFGEPGPVHHIHAVRLRPEPSYFSAEVMREADRSELILDAVRHLPRPLILYTTKRADAESWYRRIRGLGFARCGLIHGGCSEETRSVALRKWAENELDVMVATSAFGLGIDKQDVRAVLHSFLPETIDRYYQDVGRGGRDGRASLSLLAWQQSDFRTAEALAIPTFIGAERGWERWKAMFQSEDKLAVDLDTFALPLDVAPTKRSGDIDMDSEENRLWNIRTILLLARARILRVIAYTPYSLAGGKESITVRLLNQRHLDSATWTEEIEPRRNELLTAAANGFNLMKQLTRQTECVSTYFSAAYSDVKNGMVAGRACAGCPTCRRNGADPFCAPMRAKHIPAEFAWYKDVGEQLQTLLITSNRLFVFYDGDVSQVKLLEVLWPFIQWFHDEGVVNLVASRPFLDAVSHRYERQSSWAVFFSSELPTGASARLPTALVLESADALSIDTWQRIKYYASPLVVALPKNAVDPTRPTRLLYDLTASDTRLTLDQWEEYFRI